MNQNMLQRKSLKPKPNTDMGVYGRNKCNGYFILLSNDEKEMHFPAIQTSFKSFNLYIISIFLLDTPQKFGVEIPPNNSFSNDDVSSITTQAPENLSDGEEESKFCENMKLQIEEMKTKSCKIKEFQPLSNKGQPLSPIYKFQAKMAKIHPFRNLIFNPDCPKQTIREHLKTVYKSLIYGVHHLKKPKDATPQSGYIYLGEQLGTNFRGFLS